MDIIRPKDNQMYKAERHSKDTNNKYIKENQNETDAPTRSIHCEIDIHDERKVEENYLCNDKASDRTICLNHNIVSDATIKVEENISTEKGESVVSDDKYKDICHEPILQHIHTSIHKNKDLVQNSESTESEVKVGLILSNKVPVESEPIKLESTHDESLIKSYDNESQKTLSDSVVLPKPLTDILSTESTIKQEEHTKTVDLLSDNMSHDPRELLSSTLNPVEIIKDKCDGHTPRMDAIKSPIQVTLKSNCTKYVSHRDKYDWSSDDNISLSQLKKQLHGHAHRPTTRSCPATQSFASSVRFRCTVCNMKFPTASALILHEQVHDSDDSVSVASIVDGKADCSGILQSNTLDTDDTNNKPVSYEIGQNDARITDVHKDILKSEFKENDVRQRIPSFSNTPMDTINGSYSCFTSDSVLNIPLDNMGEKIENVLYPPGNVPTCVTSSDARLLNSSGNMPNGIETVCYEDSMFLAYTDSEQEEECICGCCIPRGRYSQNDDIESARKISGMDQTEPHLNVNHDDTTYSLGSNMNEKELYLKDKQNQEINKRKKYITVDDVIMETYSLDVTGETTGDSTIEVIGEASGDSTIEVIGEASGDSTIEVIGEASGEARGDSTIEVIGEASGDSTIEVIGEASGEASGDSTIDVIGEASGDSTIEVIGEASGDSTIEVIGETSGDSTIEVISETTGDSTIEDIVCEKKENDQIAFTHKNEIVPCSYSRRIDRNSETNSVIAVLNNNGIKSLDSSDNTHSTGYLIVITDDTIGNDNGESAVAKHNQKNADISCNVAKLSVLCIQAMASARSKKLSEDVHKVNKQISDVIDYKIRSKLRNIKNISKKQVSYRKYLGFAYHRSILKWPYMKWNNNKIYVSKNDNRSGIITTKNIDVLSNDSNCEKFDLSKQGHDTKCDSALCLEEVSNAYEHKLESVETNGDFDLDQDMSNMIDQIVSSNQYHDTYQMDIDQLGFDSPSHNSNDGKVVVESVFSTHTNLNIANEVVVENNNFVDQQSSVFQDMVEYVAASVEIGNDDSKVDDDAIEALVSQYMTSVDPVTIAQSNTGAPKSGQKRRKTKVCSWYKKQKRRKVSLRKKPTAENTLQLRNRKEYECAVCYQKFKSLNVFVSHQHIHKEVS